MPEFRIPTSAAEWAAVEPNETDSLLLQSWIDFGATADAHELAAASRLLEHEKNVTALATTLFEEWCYPTIEEATIEARRILGGAK